MNKMRHVVLDLITGTPFVRDRDGRDHTFEEVEQAERRAAAGDPAAEALLESLEMDTALDAAEMLEQQMHDCPECRAAMARGERPVIEFPQGNLPRSVRRRIKALARKRGN